MMKRYLIFLLLASYTLCISATVKPRNGRGSTDGSCTESSESDSRQKSPMKIGSQSTAPLKAFGSPKVPVILVQFSDKKFISGLGTSIDSSGNEIANECLTREDSITVNTFFSRFCNGTGESGSYYKDGGSYGAIREYFRDQSLGQFTPEFVVIGPVTLSNSYSYYGKNSSTSRDVNVSKFYKEAIEAAQAQYSSWSMFDNDNNNVVDMAFFIYAGEGENGGGGANTIWPHERQSGGTINSVKFGCYACCNETYKDKTDGIGVFVHELSHALGLPDFYDKNYIAVGMDYYDIMDSGCYCQDGKVPCNYTAYERDFMGWQSLITLDPSEPQIITLQPSSNGGLGYKIQNPSNPNEYLVIENRQALGWDEYLGRGTERTKMHGLLVTHVVYDSQAWSSNNVNVNASLQRIHVVPASNQIRSYMWVSDMDDYNDFMFANISTLFPGSNNVTSLLNGHEIIYSYNETEKSTVVDPSTGEETTVKTKTPHIYNYSLGNFDQPLSDITENADGSITLNYMELQTAIDKIFGNESTSPIYNLSGLHVGDTEMQNGYPASMPEVPGVYIINGKKYIVK